MRTRVATLALLWALLVPALAQEGPPAPPATAPPDAPTTPPARVIEAPHADEARAGHYTLQGVMETGSELVLERQGRFQWFFSYGALDLAARGRWRYEGADVILEVEEFLAPPGHEAMKFDRLTLRADGADLVPAWPWDGGAERGRYARE